LSEVPIMTFRSLVFRMKQSRPIISRSLRFTGLKTNTKVSRWLRYKI
jgi:hypothetical protein